MTKEEVEQFTILRATVGSTLYGINLDTPDQASDRDEMGVCVESMESVVGFHEFEQLEFRTATERTGQHDAKSEAGDLDLKIYSLKKFLRLALKGNPSVIELLFVPTERCLVKDARGTALCRLAPSIVSKQAGRAYLGYMQAQKQRLMGERGQLKVHREDLVSKFGYDTKFATHILRLGFQGVELLTTGKISLPMPESERVFCKSVRMGEVELQTMLTKAGDLEKELKDLLDNSPLPDHPDEKTVQDWMIQTYWDTWRSRRVLLDKWDLVNNRLVPPSIM